MTIAELIEQLITLPSDTRVYVETECGTLNTPQFGKYDEFVVLALPNTYDTYDGPVTKD